MSITAFQRDKTWYFSIHDKEFVRIHGERVKKACKAVGKREAIKLGEEERERLIAEARAKKPALQVAAERKLVGGKPEPLCDRDYS